MVGIKRVSNLKKENVLNFKVQLLNWKWFLDKQHKQMLTDRYLTYKILQKIDIEEYQRQAAIVKKDTKRITNKTTEKELVSNKTFTLKQAFETWELYFKFIEIKDEILSTKMNDSNIQNFLFNNLEFAFSTYYNNKKYLGAMLYYVQRFFWNVIVMIEKSNYPSAMELLKYSLQDNPKDMLITEGIIIDEIKKDLNFIEKIDEIIKLNRDKDYFEDISGLNYKGKDLMAGLNNTTMNVVGKKKDDKWNLEINITDKYDFTDFKELDEYKSGGIFSIANNCAMISVKSGVIKEYKIKIQFSIEK